MSLFRKFSNRNEIYQLFRNNYICIVFASWLRHFCYYFGDQNLQRFWQPTLEDVLQAPEIFGHLGIFMTHIMSQLFCPKCIIFNNLAIEQDIYTKIQ